MAHSGRRLRWRRALALTAVAGGVAFGAAAYAGRTGDVNTVRLEPGPRSAAEAAAVEAAKTQVGADYVGVRQRPVRPQLQARGRRRRRARRRQLPLRHDDEDLEIFDVSTPTDPQLMGTVTLDVEFENEQVPTNESVLGISGQTPSATARGICPSSYPTTPSGCLGSSTCATPRTRGLPRSRERATTRRVHPRLHVHVRLGRSDHRPARRARGRRRTASEAPANRDQRHLKDSAGYPFTRVPSQRRVGRAIVFTACDPFYFLRVVGKGASPATPKVSSVGQLPAGAGRREALRHSVRWPLDTEKFMLEGGETNFQGRLRGTSNGASRPPVASGRREATFKGPLSECRRCTAPTPTATRRRPRSTGCSVHWFEPHPSSRAAASSRWPPYDNGTRFQRVAPDGRDHRGQGFFQPLGFETSAPELGAGPDVVYSIDYQRGIDVLRWKGRCTCHRHREGSGRPPRAAPEGGPGVRRK